MFGKKNNEVTYLYTNCILHRLTLNKIIKCFKKSHINFTLTQQSRRKPEPPEAIKPKRIYNDQLHIVVRGHVIKSGGSHLWGSQKILCNKMSRYCCVRDWILCNGRRCSFRNVK